MLLCVIHNGGLVMGIAAVAACFALIAFWPETYAPRGGFKVYDHQAREKSRCPECGVATNGSEGGHSHWCPYAPVN